MGEPASNDDLKGLRALEAAVRRWRAAGSQRELKRAEAAVDQALNDLDDPGRAARWSPMCTAMGHEDVPAAGEAFVETDSGSEAWIPYCDECLDLTGRVGGEPVRRWYASVADYVGLFDGDELAAKVFLAMEPHVKDIGDLRRHVDANQRALIARVVADALRPICQTQEP